MKFVDKGIKFKSTQCQGDALAQVIILIIVVSSVVYNQHISWLPMASFARLCDVTLECDVTIMCLKRAFIDVICFLTTEQGFMDHFMT